MSVNVYNAVPIRFAKGRECCNEEDGFMTIPHVFSAAFPVIAAADVLVIGGVSPPSRWKTAPTPPPSTDARL
jgi:hypothetical protein